MDNLVKFVGGDTRSQMGCSNIEDLPRYLQRGCKLCCLHRARERRALQAFRTPSCSSLFRICGGCPNALISRLGTPMPDRKRISGVRARAWYHRECTRVGECGLGLCVLEKEGTWVGRSLCSQSPETGYTIHLKLTVISCLNQMWTTGAHLQKSEIPSRSCSSRDRV